ncbi:MAG: peroxiredoxin family protein [Kiritimatiellia bacterium]
MNGKTNVILAGLSLLATVVGAILLFAWLQTMRHPKIPSWESVVWLRGEAPAYPSPAILVFGATWCPDCVRIVPSVNDLYRKWKPRGVSVLALAIQPESEVRSSLENSSACIEFPLGISTHALHAACNKTHGVTTIPHAYLIDAKGRIQWHGEPEKADSAAQKFFPEA